MYNSNPHRITGKSPSELFYGRQFRDKLPSLINIEQMHINNQVRDKDASMKQKEKINEDRKRKARERNLEIGQKVYVKNVIKNNKLTPEFDPEPRTVVSPNRNEVNIRNDSTGLEYRRNIIHLKKVEGNWKVVDNDRDEAMDQTKENEK